MMTGSKDQINNIPLKEKLITVFEENRDIIIGEKTLFISEIRQKAFENFKKIGFPDPNSQTWKNTDLKKILSEDYEQLFDFSTEGTNVEEIFQCKIHNFDTYIVSLLNGWYVNSGSQISTMPDGTIVGSLAKAIKEFPELTEKYLGKVQKQNNNFTELNTAFSQDGIFIYVPDGVEVIKPIQMVSIINHDKNLLVNYRNLIILGKNSKLTFVQCDDAINHNSSLTNTVTEFFLNEGSNLDHYKLQNLNNNSGLINSTYFKQEKNSNLCTNLIILNGGIIRNDYKINLNGEGCNSEIYGVYLMDSGQHINNQVYVDHVKANCTSNQIFKGILDEQASGVFNGHVLVHRNAQHTSASQTNRNILLTDEASINTQPFLEIYADDVKCGHGATVGQLDKEAMFYLRSRGIGEKNARMLLMYAYAAEIINKINIEALRLRIDDMVKQRLRGELSVCDKCILHCRKEDEEINFDIDMSKV